MFLWGSLPAGMSSLQLFEIAVGQKVVFVPGDPFYTSERTTSTFRLNFSCTDEELTHEGVKRLAGAIDQLMTNC